jgi:hypothetical protein
MIVKTKRISDYIGKIRTRAIATELYAPEFRQLLYSDIDLQMCVNKFTSVIF